MATKTELLTADDLLRLYSKGVRGELIRGVLHETMPTGQQHGVIAANLSFELLSFIRPRQLGFVTTSDSGVLLERDPDTVREPDVAFFSNAHGATQPTPKYAEQSPDLVVEIVSPSDKLGNIRAKAEMWLSFGVRLIWVVHPDSRSVDIHRSGQSVESIGDDGQLDGLDVLPGFSCPVSSIFGD
jgi:Uma2 family endonuclease